MEGEHIQKMKNTTRRMIALAAVTALCLYAVPVKAEGSPKDGKGILPEILQREPEEISYIVDFLDHDGEFLDSRICEYGEKLGDIEEPERAEDEEYTYRFMGWEPELCETVTESAMYTAVYEKIPKDGSDPIVNEVSSNAAERTVSDNTLPQGKRQVSAISYDVIPFVVEKPTVTPEEKSEELSPEKITGIPAEEPERIAGQSSIYVPAVQSGYIPGTVTRAVYETAEGTAEEQMGTSMDRGVPWEQERDGSVIAGPDTLEKENRKVTADREGAEEKKGTVAPRKDRIPPRETPEALQASMAGSTEQAQGLSGKKKSYSLLALGILPMGGAVWYKRKRNL